MSKRGIILALLLGNFITASAVFGPAGMLEEIARHFGIGIQVAGLLVSLGAVVLCISSPLMTWLTSGIDRRWLLTSTVVLIALSQLAAAASTSWTALLCARLIGMAIAAIFTPQAAGTLTVLMSEKDRPAAIAMAFLGYSIAVAFGIPMVSIVASTYGWREAHAVLGILGLVVAVFLALKLPARVKGVRVSLSSWAAIARSGVLCLILLVTVLSGAAQFILLTYLKPLLAALTGQGAGGIAIDMVAFGVMTIVGNMIVTRIVPGIGAYRTSLASLGVMLVGMTLLSVGAGSIVVVTAGLLSWGLGFAASNSMQQARLANVAPALTAASISLNTSSIYIGQAIGAGIGGPMVAHGHLMRISAVAVAFIVAGLVVAHVSHRWHGRSLKADS
jgi:DHA1 family inner membrane transport protein